MPHAAEVGSSLLARTDFTSDDAWDQYRKGLWRGYGSERGSYVRFDPRADSGAAPDAVAPRRGRGGGRAYRARRLPDHGRRLRLGSGARPAVNDQPAGRGHARPGGARRGAGHQEPAGARAARLAVWPHVSRRRRAVRTALLGYRRERG